MLNIHTSLRTAVTGSIFFVVLALIRPAHAHQDAILTLGSDGAIGGLPEAFLPAHLLLDRDATGKIAGAVLRLSAGQYTFPQCLVQLLGTAPQAKVILTGSWYHSQTVLPYYIGVVFGREQNRQRSWEIRALFDLKTAKPLGLTGVWYEQTDVGTSIRDKSNFEQLCPGKKMTDGWKPVKAKSQALSPPSIPRR